METDKSRDSAKKIREIEILMLKELLRVCKKYDLRCYADGGTLLGAVRHKGFIPWDDDIDMVLFRSDYQKLLEVGKNEFKSPFFFQSYLTDKDYYRLHAQLRYDGTTAALVDEKGKVPFHQGIFIDIFPLDGVQKNGISNKLQWIQFQFWKKILNIIFCPVERKNLLLRYVNIFLYKYVRPCVDIKRIQDKITQICSKYEESQWVTLLCINRKRNRNLLQKSWFQKMEQLLFQGIMIPAPGDWDKVLTVKFGDDYLTPKQECTMHGKVIFDVHKNYIEKLNGEKDDVSC